MKLLFSPTFERRIKRLLKKDAGLKANVGKALKLLETDVFHPALKTHKLKGKLEGRWACTIAYDLRIVFEIIQFKNVEAILLLTVGTNDEIY